MLGGKSDGNKEVRYSEEITRMTRDERERIIGVPLSHSFVDSRYYFGKSQHSGLLADHAIDSSRFIVFIYRCSPPFRFISVRTALSGAKGCSSRSCKSTSLSTKCEVLTTPAAFLSRRKLARSSLLHSLRPPTRFCRLPPSPSRARVFTALDATTTHARMHVRSRRALRAE